jgi:uncharacterized membrane protein (DUF373 family)
MALRKELSEARVQWGLLTLYQKFEHAIILILTGLIAVVIVIAVWKLAFKIVTSIFTSTFDPTDYEVFQVVFGMIFTVLIALEFKRSLLVVAERRDSVVQVRTVVLIALLAIVRKLLILDLSSSDAAQVLALAGAILALGGVYWLVRDQDRRQRE